MRILIYGINYAPEWIGIGKFTSEFVQFIQQHGHEVRVITSPPYYPHWKIHSGYSAWHYTSEILEGSKIYRCPLWVPSKPSALTRILHLASFAITSSPILLWQAVCWHPDLILTIAPAFFCAPMARVAAWFCGSKSWLHVQDFELDAALEMQILKLSFLDRWVMRLQNWLFQTFNVVSSISHRMLERLEQKGVLPSRIVYFPNWSDMKNIFPISSYNTLRHELNIPNELPVVLYSGNMGEKQGLEIVLQAAQLLEHERMLFLLCGKGAAEKRLKQQASHLGNVRFLDLQAPERFNELLNLACVHLLPQRKEAADLVMPSKLLDILSCGGFVIATAYPKTELGQVVLAAGGLLCEPGNAQQLAQIIQQQIAILANHHGKNNLQQSTNINASTKRLQIREYALQHFCREKVLSRILDEIENKRVGT